MNRINVYRKLRLKRKTITNLNYSAMDAVKGGEQTIPIENPTASANPCAFDTESQCETSPFNCYTLNCTNIEC